MYTKYTLPIPPIPVNSQRVLSCLPLLQICMSLLLQREPWLPVTSKHLRFAQSYNTSFKSSRTAYCLINKEFRVVCSFPLPTTTKYFMYRPSTNWRCRVKYCVMNYLDLSAFPFFSPFRIGMVFIWNIFWSFLLLFVCFSLGFSLPIRIDLIFLKNNLEC